MVWLVACNNNAGLNLDYCEPLMQHVYLRGPKSAINVAEDYSVVLCFSISNMDEDNHQLQLQIILPFCLYFLLFRVIFVI